MNAPVKPEPGAATRAALASQAQALGFAEVAVTRPDSVAAAGVRLRQWVGQGQHGDMAWMAGRIDWRASPEALWPKARSVIVLAEPYTPDGDPLAVLDQQDRGGISVYARGRDYHDVVKKRLKRLGRWLIERHGGEIKVFVDTAPVMEKPLAEAAGLGWQGKHTNLVSRRLGSWFFLGAIFTTLELAPDTPHSDHCGACRRCLDICPTAAFPAPYQLDARRCISYLTIELKGPIPRELRPLIGNRVFGCDDCLAVCPWNKFAAAANAAYVPREGAEAPLLAELAVLDDAAFRARFSGSGVKRTGRGRFLRNVMVAIGNSGQPELIGVADAATRDADPLVRGHAVWALSRLAGAERFRAAMRADADPFVAEEWRLGLGEVSSRPPPSSGA
ncbi:MAG: tRNA epoxyqueuosine(34) reductase QueG [Paracoccaceae bacterium]